MSATLATKPTTYATHLDGSPILARDVCLSDTPMDPASHAHLCGKVFALSCEYGRKLMTEGPKVPPMAEHVARGMAAMDRLRQDQALLDAQEAAPPWPVLAEDAFHGLAGEIVRAIEPQSEADPVALLVQLLAAFGSAIGRGPHLRIEADRHHTNLYVVLVGATAGGRKGTSWGQVRAMLEPADPDWSSHRVVSGLSSAEGLIWSVRDAIKSREKIKAKGRIVQMQEYESDPGVSDKRLFVLEPEFANVLKQAERTGNTLSAILRMAWERGDLRTLTRNDPVTATGAHISVVGHITKNELLKYLTATETANGFSNRFLFIATRQSKYLPFGGQPVDASAFTHRLRVALADARKVSELKLDSQAREVWAEVYRPLSTGRAAFVGAICGRAAPQTLRLATLYALLDGANTIRAEHLAAALAVWDFAEASVRMIFGNATGDDVADTILAGLKRSPDGLSRTEISGLFHRNQPAARIDAALAMLLRDSLAYPETQDTGGGPREVWRATK